MQLFLPTIATKSLQKTVYSHVLYCSYFTVRSESRHLKRKGLMYIQQNL